MVARTAQGLYLLKILELIKQRGYIPAGASGDTGPRSKMEISWKNGVIGIVGALDPEDAGGKIKQCLRRRGWADPQRRFHMVNLELFDGTIVAHLFGKQHETPIKELLTDLEQALNVGTRLVLASEKTMYETLPSFEGNVP